MSASRWRGLGSVLVMVAAWACSSGSENGAANGEPNGEPSGGLPCEGLAVDCRLAFSGDYAGTFEGADTGTLTFYVNVIGGIDGMAKGSKLGAPAITGQVNEFGKLELTTADGVELTGQFAADHSFSGTWKGEPGSGTFEGQVAKPTGGGGSGSGGSNAGGGGGPQPDPGTGYEPSGNNTYDDATVICSACQAEATACHDLPDCWDYAVCAEACPGADIYCIDRCWDEHPSGHEAWFDAIWCEGNECFGL